MTLQETIELLTAGLDAGEFSPLSSLVADMRNQYLENEVPESEVVYWTALMSAAESAAQLADRLESTVRGTEKA